MAELKLVDAAQPAPQSAAIQKLTAVSTEPLTLQEALELAESVIEATAEVTESKDLLTTDETQALSQYLNEARQEICALQPNEIKNNKIPEAGRELDAVVSHAEDATTTIMRAGEAILEADHDDLEAYKTFVEGQIIEIFQACSFQDITGQRIEKVACMLGFVETRLARLLDATGIRDTDYSTQAEAEAAERAVTNHLHGPDLPENANNQSAIDEMFNQDDIDALFD